MCPTSSLRVDFSIHAPSMRSRSRDWACAVVKPFLLRVEGLSHAGERVTSKRRPPVENSQMTSGTAAGPAWSLRSDLLPWRTPGREP